MLTSIQQLYFHMVGRFSRINELIFANPNHHSYSVPEFFIITPEDGSTFLRLGAFYVYDGLEGAIF